MRVWWDQPEEGSRPCLGSNFARTSDDYYETEAVLAGRKRNRRTYPPSRTPDPSGPFTNLATCETWVPDESRGWRTVWNFDAYIQETT